MTFCLINFVAVLVVAVIVVVVVSAMKCFVQEPFIRPWLILQVLFSIAVLNNNMNKRLTPNMCFLSASDWFKLLIIFMS